MTMAEEADQEGGRKKRKAIAASRYRWPNNRVPYEISSTFSKSYIYMSYKCDFISIDIP